MAVDLELQWDEVETTAASAANENVATLRYFAYTDNDEEEPDVRIAVLPLVPDFYGNLLFVKLDIRRHQESNDVWECIAHFEHASSQFTLPELEVDDVRWSIRGGSGSTRQRQHSFKLITEVVHDDFKPDYEFAGTPVERMVGILVEKADGESKSSFKGRDYLVGTVEIDVQTVKDYMQVSAGYLTTCASWAAQYAISNAQWQTFAAGTLQLTSFNAVERGGDDADWDISMSFLFSPDLMNVKIGSLTVPKVPGHALLDVTNVKQKSSNGIAYEIPVRAAVHQWYPAINFSTVLGV